MQVLDVHKTFGGPNGPVEALRGVEFSLREGEFMVMVGPSGCGKSTLLQIIAGLEKADRGEVILRGERIRGWGRERVLIFQEPHLFPWLTVRENIEFGLKVMGVPKGERRKVSERFIAVMGLQGFDDHYPHELSGGMRQRVALARALAVDPLVLLMDEPFASVDAITRSRLQGELEKIWMHYHKTIIFVTHNLREALLLGSRIALLTPRPGRIKAIFEVDIPRPRQNKLKEMAWWETFLMRELE
ncbi:MAG: ABC transporter ATP-binding protein, partial [Deltaproteobacteria bacterium]